MSFTIIPSTSLDPVTVAAWADKVSGLDIGTVDPIVPLTNYSTDRYTGPRAIVYPENSDIDEVTSNTSDIETLATISFNPGEKWHIELGIRARAFGTPTGNQLQAGINLSTSGNACLFWIVGFDSTNDGALSGTLSRGSTGSVFATIIDDWDDPADDDIVVHIHGVVEVGADGLDLDIQTVLSVDVASGLRCRVVNLIGRRILG